MVPSIPDALSLPVRPLSDRVIIKERPSCTSESLDE